MSRPLERGRLEVTAIIVNFNSQHRSVALAEVLSEELHHVVIVSNSGEGAPEGLPANVTWLPLMGNVGFGGAVMAAHRCAVPSPVTAVLNPDAQATCEQLEELCRILASDSSVGIVGPLLLDDDRRMQSGAGTVSRISGAPEMLSSAGRLDRRGSSGSRSRGATAPVSCAWVTGAYMVLRSRVLTEVGFLPMFFLGMEDAEICLRAGANGWRTVFVASVEAKHAGHATFRGPDRAYYRRRNRLLLQRLQRHWLRFILEIVWAVCAVIPRFVVSAVVKRGGLDAVGAAMEGVRDGSTGRLDVDAPWPRGASPNERQRLRSVLALDRGQGAGS